MPESMSFFWLVVGEPGGWPVEGGHPAYDQRGQPGQDALGPDGDRGSRAVSGPTGQLCALSEVSGAV